MRLLMVHRDLTVKQYHLACALMDRYGYDCYMMTLEPFTFNWRAGLNKFPSPRHMLGRALYQRAHQARLIHNSPFKELFTYNPAKVAEIDPDVVYFTGASHNNEKVQELIESFDKPFICDVEDSALFHYDALPTDALLSRIVREQKAIANEKVKLVLWGCRGERRYAEQYHNATFRMLAIATKPFITVYPLVAKRTLRFHAKSKRNRFSVVYLGSVYPNGYRNYIPAIERIGRSNISLTVYLLNSFHPSVLRILQKLASKYPSLTIRKFVPFDKAKEEISQYHVGLGGCMEDYAKYRVTYGMKPLEYAYAGVQPASIGLSMHNLSDGQEFSYCCTPETIERDYEHNLDRFDYEAHLMDNNLEELHNHIEDGL